MVLRNFKFNTNFRQPNRPLTNSSASIYLFILNCIAYEQMSNRLVGRLTVCIFFSLNGDQMTVKSEQMFLASTNSLTALKVSIAERRVFRWLNEPTGQRLFAAVRRVLLAYGTTRLPSGKWLLIMKVERSTCNYSTPWCVFTC